MSFDAKVFRTDFLIGGAQKSGTTALHHYLSLHPEITLASEKEVHFFDNDSLFESETVNYDTYHLNFDSFQQGRVYGEATPIYMYWDSCAERVFQYNPRMKWIIVLRNPISRAFSQWNMEFSRGTESLPFMQAIEAEQSRLKLGCASQCRVRSYIDRGKYSSQIIRLQQIFGADRLLILESNELRTNPSVVMSRVCSFLGVSEMLLLTPSEVFALPYRSKISSAEWSFLYEQLETEIDHLEMLLGWDCSAWRAF